MTLKVKLMRVALVLVNGSGSKAPGGIMPLSMSLLSVEINWQ